MTAKVLYGGEVYYSPVLALSWQKSSGKAIILSEDGSSLVSVKVFGDRDYRIFFIDFDTEGYSITENNFKSFWNDRKIFGAVKRRRHTVEMLKDARALAMSIDKGDFISINSHTRLHAFETATGYFHDGNILGIMARDEALEILIYSGWGEIIQLICKGVSENRLKVGDFFFDCKMSISDEGEVTLAFVPMSNGEDLILQAKEMSYKPLFIKKITISDIKLDMDGKRAEACGREIKLPHLLDLEEQGIIGYQDNDDLYRRMIIFDENVAYYIHTPADGAKKQNSLIEEMIRGLLDLGFKLREYDFDCDCDDTDVDFGDVIYSQKYTLAHWLLSILAYLVPALAAYNLIWLMAQIFSPGMGWGIFFAIGPGVSAICLFTILVMILVKKQQEKKSDYPDQKAVEICEGGIKYNGYAGSWYLTFEDITDVKQGAITTLFAHGQKYRLPPSKNNSVIYKIITEKLTEVRGKKDT